MLSFLLPLAGKIVSDAVSRIPDNAQLGAKLIEIAVMILEKAVKLTNTTMDDQLLEVVKSALESREPEEAAEPSVEPEAEGGE